MLSLRTRLVIGHGLLVCLLLMAVATGLIALDHIEAMLPEPSRRDVEPIVRVAIGVLSVIVILGLALLLSVSRVVHRALVERIGNMIDVSRARSRGDRLRRADMGGGGELGQVAQFINVMLDELDALEGKVTGHSSHLQLALTGLLDRAAQPSAVLTPDGTVLASTMSPEETRALADVSQDIRKSTRAEPARETFVLRPGDGGAAIRLQRLVGPGQTDVGWLVEAEP